MRSSDPNRIISITGIIFTVLGLGMVLFELQTDFMLRRLGLGGKVVIFGCGTALSVWGLKEVIAGYWPRQAGRGYHFSIPLEGGVFLMIMIVLFIGSLIGRNNPLMMVFAVMAGPFVMNGWFTFTMLKGLKVSRDIPERIMTGETFTAAVRLTNSKSWLTVWLMTVHDSISHRVGALAAEVLFVRVPPSSSRTGHYQLRLDERGAYRFGPVDVTTRFPLGLVERGIRLDVPGEVLVYPRIGRLHSHWRQLVPHSMELVGNVRPQKGPFNDELHRLREFRSGDDSRRIHWRTSARMDELMVCEYQESRDRDLVLVVDAWLPEKPDEEVRDHLELGLRFATTIAVDQLHKSRESSLVVRFLGERTTEWSGGSSERDVDQLLDEFALVAPSSRRTLEELNGCLEMETGWQRRFVVITTRPDRLREQLLNNSDSRGVDIQVFGASPEELAFVYEDA